MDVVETSGKAGVIGGPNAVTLRNAAFVSLGRHPDSATAQAFTSAAVPLVVPHMPRARALGRKGIVAMQRDLGIILAGVMRPGLEGAPVRVHASSSGFMWDVVQPGFRRFWAIADALIAAGLLGKRVGVRTPETGLDRYGGLATALWPTAALVGLAAAHGVTEGTRKADWRADASLQASPRKIAKGQLVTCKFLKGVAPAVTPGMAADMDCMAGELHALNAANAAADIRGAGHTVAMVRRFRHSLAFGGRFYAPVSTVAADDRLRISINGEPVAEVDVKASQLTVLLGIAGQREAPTDAYEVPGIPRSVVKAWMVQTLGTGRPIGRWGANTAPEVRTVKPDAVWKALRPAYPFLADLPGLVPTGLLDSLPPTLHGWGGGQWVVQREAAIIARAMSDLMHAGVPVLSIHDSLLCPVGSVDLAKQALRAAFMDLAGITPRIRVDSLDGMASGTPGKALQAV